MARSAISAFLASLFPLLFTLLVLHSNVHGFTWIQANNCRWAASCDFVANDLSSTRVPGDQCSNVCAAAGDKCTHFAWLSGICYLKGGAVSTMDATAGNNSLAVCGIMNTANSGDIGPWTDASNCQWASGCDFLENDISSSGVAAWDQCSHTCAAAGSKCTHFAWLSGICYLKSRAVSITDAIQGRDSSAVCGIMKSGLVPSTTPPSPTSPPPPIPPPSPSPPSYPTPPSPTSPPPPIPPPSPSPPSYPTPPSPPSYPGGSGSVPPLPGLELRWSDEFALGAINKNNWDFQYGDGSLYDLPGWGNGELECYTDQASNAAIVADSATPSNGMLNITAASQPGHSCDNKQAGRSTRDWTSARLSSRGLQSFMWSADGTPLYVEARVKIPLAKGAWPAFWMLPEPNAYGGWCASGEIDIMEHVNDDSLFYGTLHYGGVPGGNDWQDCREDGGKTDIGLLAAGDWHTYAVKWTPKYVSFLLDGHEYHRSNSNNWVSSRAAGNAGKAPFDEPFYLIVNLAIGGKWPGNNVQPGSHTMLLDWIRVWDMVGYS